MSIASARLTRSFKPVRIHLIAAFEGEVVAYLLRCRDLGETIEQGRGHLGIAERSSIGLTMLRLSRCSSILCGG